MLCPCCGKEMNLEATACACGARFIGAPLEEPPIKVQRLGPVMTAGLLFALVTVSALVFTYWLAFAGVLVLWRAVRAVRLARSEPDHFGGYRTAMAMLIVTVTVGSGALAYGISRVPRFLENRQIRKIAATRAEMYHIANMLEDHKRTYGSYPPNIQAIKTAAKEPLPTDYWQKSIKYLSYTEAVVDASLQRTGIPLNNFELRSAGPDGVEGTDDDIIMRDGMFYTASELQGQPRARDTASR